MKGGRRKKRRRKGRGEHGGTVLTAERPGITRNGLSSKYWGNRVNCHAQEELEVKRNRIKKRTRRREARNMTNTLSRSRLL